MAPTGQQTVRSFFGRPLAAVRAEPRTYLTEALTWWKRHEGHTGEMLDASAYVSAADSPDGMAYWESVPGAVWLATHALPLDPLTVQNGRVQTGLWRHRPADIDQAGHRLPAGMRLALPMWLEPLNLPQIRTVLAAGGTGHGARVREETYRLPVHGWKSRGLLL